MLRMSVKTKLRAYREGRRASEKIIYDDGKFPSDFAKPKDLNVQKIVL